MKQILVLLTVIFLFAACKNEDKRELKTEQSQQLELIKKERDMYVEISDRNKTNAHAFLKALEAKDIDVLLHLFSTEAKHINPYASGIFSDGAEGLDEIRAYWEPVFPNFLEMNFPVEDIYAMEDPSIVFVKFKGSIQLKDEVSWYENDYYATFKFDEKGKITEYVEIFNPIVAAKGFGLIDKIK